jgi:hypothetical protein
MAGDELIIWATVDQNQIIDQHGQPTRQAIRGHLDRHHPIHSQNTVINNIPVAHFTIAVAGTIEQRHGETYVISKNGHQRTLLTLAIAAVEKAVKDEVGNLKKKFSSKYNAPIGVDLYGGAKFSTPKTGDYHFYVIQNLLNTKGKHHRLCTLAEKIKYELSKLGLETGEFRPHVSLAHIDTSKDKIFQAYGHLLDSVHYPKIFKDVPEVKGLTCSNVVVFIGRADRQNVIGTYDFK